ncbi:unnamed protein product [Paramecium primaurelia]|uniref:Uncharacterized protein n=1 Tax=Paramecium primaurelia TaxID=5886 RepID=A0A8S1MFW9_PARPR|nr:unnamed protein product [Paramecium primaurelia]
MSVSPPKSQSLSADRRKTSLFMYPFPKPPSVSHLPIFNMTINKENVQPQKQSWNMYQQSQQLTTVSQKKKPQKFIELESQKDPKVKYKFPIFTDNQLGIKLEYQQLLQETYDNDDDINTRESVMQYFIEVCKQDLVQGMRENQTIKDKKGNPIINFAGLQNRLKEQYTKIEIDAQIVTDAM